jgi:hypothetical protein
VKLFIASFMFAAWIIILAFLAGCDTAPVTERAWLPASDLSYVDWDGGATVCEWGPFWRDCDGLDDAGTD